MTQNPFGSQHFHAIGPFLKAELGGRIAKLSIDAGFTCPTRDGSKGYGGCSFCASDGGGHYASNIPEQIRLLSKKWPDSRYLAFFQSYTNTYEKVEVLRSVYEEALSQSNVVGLAIATRPDCLPPDVLSLLAELNQKTYLWVELGLQTSSDQTAAAVNRGYSFSVFEEAMHALNTAGIRTVIHLIFGLPGEDRKTMLASIDAVVAFQPFGIKLHQLYLMEDSKLGQAYQLYGERVVRPLEKKEYIELLVDALERIPQTITIHRLTGDPPQGSLLAPAWSTDKRSILNGVQQEFKRRGSFQGSAFQKKRNE